MPTDPALAAALAEQFTPAELAALHQRLVEELDHADEITPDDPLGRLCDALHTAAWPTTTSVSPTSTGTTTQPTVHAARGTHA